jgi:hypothetical protein
MPASDDNTVNITPLVLGDTFYEWMQVTNRDIIGKLNEITAYSVTGGDGVSATTNQSGQVQLEIASNVTKGITFHGDVVFGGTITRINSIELSVDDFNIVLGAVQGEAGTADSYIGNSGGGGMILTRSQGASAEFLWKPQPDYGALKAAGCSGAWHSNQNIAFTGGCALMSTDDKLKFKTNSGTGSGLMISTGGLPGNCGPGFENAYSMKLSHMGTGCTGTTQGIFFDEDGMVRIYDGVNKKVFTYASHGFTFGHAVRIGAGGTCQLAHAGTKADAEVFGIVSEVLNANQFVVTMNGEIHGSFTTALGGVAGSTLMPGDAYFLSGSGGGSGEITSTEITDAGMIRKPTLIGLGATSGYVVQYVGARIAAESDSGAPVVKRISVNADATSNHGSVGISAVNAAAGRYTITHNFGTTSYTAVASWAGGAEGRVSTYSKSSNDCEIRTYGSDMSTLTNNAFELLLGKDVT